jgi:Fmp27/BLTP2/Hobbit, GFWDK motif-containg RBG unit
LLGFWDKLRLICHWRLKASFVGDVHIHLKGMHLKSGWKMVV